jgi:hypothetical protein
MSESNIYLKLNHIQTKLKAPKSQYNSFGKYNYRNCEDILEAVKPLLSEENCSLIIFDTIELIGERIYVKATVKFIDNESHQEITTQAFAREEESKKGMDGSQVTGASSSYARKYALNGLFLIDDTKDSDTTNTGTKDTKSILTDGQIKRAYAIAKENELGEDAIKTWIKAKFKKESLKDLTKIEYDGLCEALQRAKQS